MLELKTLALIIGPACLVFCIPCLVVPENALKSIKRFVKDKTAMQIMGFVSLILGFTILTVNHTLNKSWETLIVAIGYLSVIKGTINIWLPDVAERKVKFFLKNPSAVLLAGLICVILYGGITYLGLYVY